MRGLHIVITQFIRFLTRQPHFRSRSTLLYLTLSLMSHLHLGKEQLIYLLTIQLLLYNIILLFMGLHLLYLLMLFFLLLYSVEYLSMNVR